MEMILFAGSTLVILALAFCVYLVSSLCVVKVLKLFEYERPQLGWVPGFRYYALGTVCTQKSGAFEGLFNIALPNAVLQWGWVAVMGVYFIPNIGNFLGLILSVLYYGAIYRFIYSRLFGEDNVTLAAVSAVINIVFYFKILTGGLDECGRISSRPGDLYPPKLSVQKPEEG